MIFVLLVGRDASAQTVPAELPPGGLQPQFRTITFTNVQDEERSLPVVGPDVRQPIVRTGAQIQSRNKIHDEDTDFVIRTDLPGPERLFDTRKSEEMMREFIRRDTQVRTGQNRILFPEYAPLTNEVYTGRHFPRQMTQTAHPYVCHGRLYFEQPNFERVGWEIGYLTPVANLAVYYYDLFMLPYHSWTDPCICYDCSAGKCNPGDRAPLYLYREPFSVSGLAAQSLFIGTGFVAFP